jgi:cytoskeleton protein RodZ
MAAERRSYTWRTMSTGIGEALRAARRQQGRSLADAAAATRVRESYLAALEEEEFAALGGDVYVKGFLRSYAKFLGLDDDAMLEAYRLLHERPEEAPPIAPQRRPIDPDQRDGLPPIAIAGAVALALLGLFALFNRGEEDPGPTVPAPAPVTESERMLAPDDAAGDDAAGDAAVSTAPSMDPNAPAVEETETETVEGPLRIRVVVGEGGSGLRVIADGVVRLDSDQPSGTDLTFEAEESVTFRITNAAAVRLVVNGEDQGELGAPDEVVNLHFVVAS